jgi:hypothetical protein
MKINPIKRLVFQGEGASLEIDYDNRGDPYLQGITIGLKGERLNQFGSVFLEQREVADLRDWLNRFMPPMEKKP